MTEIRFYHLERQRLEDALPALLHKAYSMDHKILIKGTDKNRIKQLNEYLWVRNPNDFLPHGSTAEKHAKKQPILLTHENDNLNNADMLVLIDGAEHETLTDFKLACLMFDGNNENHLKQARETWKSLKNDDSTKDCEITYWQQTEKGWEKKA